MTDMNEKLDFINRVVERQYEVETAETLYNNRKKRENLIHNGGIFDKAKKALWRLFRKQDIKAIKDDWKKNQPEKYALHIIKSINRCQVAMSRAQSEGEKRKYLNRSNKIFAENKKWIDANKETFNAVLEAISNGGPKYGDGEKLFATFSRGVDRFSDKSASLDNNMSLYEKIANVDSKILKDENKTNEILLKTRIAKSR